VQAEPGKMANVAEMLWRHGEDSPGELAVRSGGVEWTYGRLRKRISAFAGAVRAAGVEPGERVLLVAPGVPEFTAAYYGVVMGAAMHAGASLSLLPRFGAAAALRMIETDRLTIFAGVPTMYNAILHAAEGGSADISSLRVCLSGGASLPDELLKGFAERFGAVILEGYALTECTGAATFNGLDRPRKAGYVGIPLPGMDVRVVDSAGSELGPGEVGEVIIRGPTVMKGFHGRPEATAEAIRDGWLHSGDLGAKDCDGDLRIVDRIKDLIIRGGYNVYPREVEEVLFEHPAIVELAIVGVEDDHLGEQVAAVVALRPGAVADAESLRAWAKERLSPYKVPTIWRFVRALPKGPTGKILKRAIDRSEFAAAARGAGSSRPASAR
jgi:long-chain acyl-CoA synthetase